jgi:FAD/FMN-containing dehydrogenase
MAVSITKLGGWGRYPVQSCELERPERYRDLRPSSARLIVRGQGRSYGDAALNENGRVLLTERINRLLDFDMEQGVLHAEAGVTLADLLEIIVPHGWFLPVTPGTKFVSLGGCVAADVHGKNHHRDGSFGKHVLGLELILASGERIWCSPAENSEQFWATVGGMGLTGIIGEVQLKLQPVANAWMSVRHRAASNLERLFELLQDPQLDDHYAVAWLDSLATGKGLGRGIAMFAHHAEAGEVPAGLLPAGAGRGWDLPFDLPRWVMNRQSISAFNDRYYRRQAAKREPFFSGHDAYFYPLDSIGHWNRLYGKHGFVQYQCVLPEASAHDGIAQLLEALARSGPASFLAVLKRLGAEGSGLLSFPLAGYTLALDLPVRDHELFALLDALDEIVIRHGGRVYLAKDARLSAQSFRAMYPGYEQWLRVKNSIDPENKFSSSLSRRLEIGSGA